MTRRRQDLFLVSTRKELRVRVREILLGEGVRVATFDTAAEALERARQAAPTLAVADMEAAPPGALPELRGGLPVTCRLVAVGAPDDEAMAAAAREGAAYVLREPLDEPLFLQVVRTLLEMSALVEENLDLRNELRHSKSLVMKDDLTSAYNRRYFDTFLEEEIERSRRFGSCLSLIFMDLDNLKKVNNRFGHAMGSLALREAAVRILDTVRSIDKAVRWGGDEFCIILPETDWRGAREVAERVRARFGDGPFLKDVVEGGVVLTASFGIASFPEHADNKDDLVSRADEAMFRIKSARKNGILVAGS